MTTPVDHGTQHGSDLGSEPTTMAAHVLRDSPPTPRRSWRGPLLSYLLTMFVLVSLNFFLPRAMPGDPIGSLLARGSPDYVPEDDVRAELEAYYDLDEPLLAQYGHYLASLARGDLGDSIYLNRPVVDVIRERLPWTVLLIGSSMLLAVLVGLPAGVLSGWRRGRGVDRGLLGLFLVVQNLPVFFVGSFALLLFAAQLGWVPMSGATTPFTDYGPLHRALDVAHHLVLPATLMALEFAALQYLLMRAAMVSELGADYLLLGRAKGLRDRRLKYGYAARNALLPVVAVIGVQFGLAVASAVFTERIFSYPGVGMLMIDSVTTRDYPVVQGCFLLLAVAVVSVNFLADALYGRLDPRTAAAA